MTFTTGEQNARLTRPGQVLQSRDRGLGQRRAVNQDRLWIDVEPPGTTALAVPIRREKP